VCLDQKNALIGINHVVMQLMQYVARIEACGGVFREGNALTFSHADGVTVALWKKV
jgi:hypothetical protein